MDMDIGNIIVEVLLLLVMIITYFLNRTIRELDKVKEANDTNLIKITLLENNHTHLTDKFVQLYDAVKELTSEIKTLNIKLNQKSDKI